MGEVAKTLQKVSRLPANLICADCGAPSTGWASITLGVFFCLRCSGIHRSLGSHISFVRSVTLDTWTAEQVNRMIEVGNVRGKAIWEAKLPANFSRPEDTGRVDQFIKDKYVRRIYSSSSNVTEIEKRSAPKPVPPTEQPAPRSSRKPADAAEGAESSRRDGHQSRTRDTGEGGRRSERSERSERSDRGERGDKPRTDRSDKSERSSKSSRKSEPLVEKASGDSTDWHSDLLAGLMTTEGNASHQTRAHKPSAHAAGSTHTPSKPAQSSGAVLSLFDAPVKFTDTAAVNTSMGTGVSAGRMMDIMALFDQPDHIFQPKQ